MIEKNVRVLLSTYNGEKYLETQLNSLQKQQGIRVLITARDDGSNDRTCEILERFSGTLPLTLIYGENVGAARSFLKLVHAAEAEAEYYAYCDQDDYWQPEKLLRAVEKLENCDNSVPALYYSNVKRVGALLEEISDPFQKNYHTEAFGAALVSTAAPGCTMVFNKALLMLLKEYMPGYVTMHDSWTLQVCAAVGGKIIYDDNSYILYRQHGENVIGGDEKMRYGKAKLFVYRVRKLFQWKTRPSRVAEELLDGYRDKMTEENYRLAVLGRNINRSFTSAVSVLFFGVIIPKSYTPYRIINFKYFLQALCKKA